MKTYLLLNKAPS